MMHRVEEPFRILGIAITLVVLLSACASIRTRERPDPREDWVYTVRSRPRATAEDFRTGELRYRGTPIGSYFSSIVIDESKFDFSIRTPENSFHGYRRDLDFEPPDTVSDGVFTRRDRNRGWYFAGLASRKPETPAWWIWVRRENLEAFLNPNRIEEFTGEYRLRQISPVVETRIQLLIQYSTQL